MNAVSLPFRYDAQKLAAAMALLVCCSAAGARDTYNPSNNELTIPAVTLGNATYSNMVITVGTVLSGPSGTSPYGSQDTFNPASRQLTIPSVLVGTRTLFNVIVMEASLISIGTVTGVDSYDGTHLSIPFVQVGGTQYNNVVITVGNIVSVAGGMPTVAEDEFIAATGQLTIPAVQFDGKVYTNVVIAVGKILAVGGNSSAPLVWDQGSWNDASWQ
jgi:hypothetical protein